MKIIYKYIAAFSNSLIDFLNERNIDYEIIRIMESARVIFYSFDDLNDIPDNRIINCKLTEKNAVFSKSEYENAKWLSFSCSKCILSSDVIDKAFSFHEHTMIQMAGKFHRHLYNPEIRGNNGRALIGSIWNKF